LPGAISVLPPILELFDSHLVRERSDNEISMIFPLLIALFPFNLISSLRPMPAAAFFLPTPFPAHV
jgi:hypothetical protein